MSQIIAMWSGPRNLSTAMMRSFGSRADCAVMDEPYFAPYLNATGKLHPGRAETLAAHENCEKAVNKLCAQDGECDYVFQKHMPHHMLPDFPMDWASSAKHFFLLRHPRRVIASYAKGRADFDADDLGFAPQLRLYDKIADLTGTPPPVIHSEEILRAPETALRGLCAALELLFDPAMLAWEAGAREEDGAWAPFWYGSVESSTGFAAPPNKLPKIAPKYAPILAQALEDYAALCEKVAVV